MKVLNLRCASDHRFEGWFASDADFASQADGGLIGCPICEDKAITRLPSAPRLNVSTQRQREQQEASAPSPADLAAARAQGDWMRVVREVMSQTEDVGDRFPEEARRIHYGEAKERGIRGHASSDDANALREEGIEVVSLPLPAVLKGPVQ